MKGPQTKGVWEGIFEKLNVHKPLLSRRIESKWGFIIDGRLQKPKFLNTLVSYPLKVFLSEKIQEGERAWILIHDQIRL
ncbi:hypothetical protein ACQZV8_06945 [Magnetococcales bacterium HHB-1]